MEVKLINYMGDDLQIVNAARVSFSKQSEWEYLDKEQIPEGWRDEDEEKWLSERDTKLIKYLASHNHWTPFGHTSITLHLKAPIFVARQLGKHQVGMVWNEVSRRYVKDSVELYFPEFWRETAPSIKQGSSNKEVKLNSYGNGFCVRCGEKVPRKTTGPRGKWCSSRCRSAFRREKEPDYRLNDAKFNAQRRGIPFDLKKGDVNWVSHCPILGIELDYSGSGNGNTDRSPSVDRVDSSKGYSKDNVWVISNKANRMKNDGTPDELVTFARSILRVFNGQVVPEDGTVKSACNHMVKYYEHLLSEGVCPEQARMVLPQNTYTEWFWTGNLYGFANIYNLRTDSHTQKETRDLVHQFKDIIEPLFPVSWRALTE